jgi:hypothetical protein
MKIHAIAWKYLLKCALKFIKLRKNNRIIGIDGSISLVN